MLLLYILNLFITIKCVIKLHFKKKYNNIDNNIDYYDYLCENDLITEISIGNPIQKIPVNIKYDSESFYITNFKGIFNYKNSKTFKSNFSEIDFSIINEGIKKGYIAKDNINLNFKKKSKIKEEELLDIYFLYINEFDSSNINLGSIGLCYKEYSKYKNLNLIIQLKKRELINNYGFTFEFINNNEGDLYLGEYPHEYNNSYYDNLDFYYSRTSYSNMWFSTFTNVSYGNLITTYGNVFYLNPSLGGIKASKYLKSTIDNSFFLNLLYKEKKCKEIYKKSYSYYICDSDIDITKFQNISFYHHDMNYTFILTYQDIFELINNKLYCKLLFPNEMTSTWHLGQPFLKKYKFTFDQDKKRFGFYIKIKEQKNNIFNLTNILIFIFIILIIILVYIIFNYIKRKQRKIRANELEENIDYLPINS